RVKDADRQQPLTVPRALSLWNFSSFLLSYFLYMRSDRFCGSIQRHIFACVSKSPALSASILRIISPQSEKDITGLRVFSLTLLAARSDTPIVLSADRIL